MKLGIDCREIYDVKSGAGAGVARYIFNLVKALLKQQHDEYEFVLFFNKKISRETIEELATEGKFTSVFVCHSIPLISAHFYFPWLIKNSSVDQMIFPANTMPLFCFQRAIVVVHDLAIYLRPEWFPAQWFSTKVLVPWSLMKAEKIIAVSRNTKKDILEIFPNIEDDRVAVVYPAGSLPYALPQVGGKGRYVVFVGTLEPRKNVANLLRAFEKYLDETGADVKLKLVSAWGWKTGEIYETLRAVKEKYPDAVEFVGAVDDKKKAEVIAGAAALLFPSFYEGFGLPVVEAMALGTPVITSRGSSLEEISNGAAVLIDPAKIDEIKDAIKKILVDQEFADELIARGRIVASQFSWDKSANVILNLFQDRLS
jgi:glycosyltransferase involved in cell wall biosynthesis